MNNSHNSKEIRLIAHRGGVTEEHGENTRGALEAAVAQAYWMIETDLRETSDRFIVVHHDATLRRLGNDSFSLDEHTLAELTEAFAASGIEGPMRFEELCERASGRIQLMLDFKPGPRSSRFFPTVARVLRRYGLDSEAMVIGTREARRYFADSTFANTVRCAISSADLGGQEADANRTFLFEHGRDLDTDTVRRAQDLGIPVVPSINVNHYRDSEDSTLPRRDCQRLLNAGVREFQIDSAYASCLDTDFDAARRPG